MTEPTTKLCELCHKPYETMVPGSSKFCKRPPCRDALRARDNEEQKRRYREKNPVILRECRHCRQMFTPRTKHSNRREVCYDNPECQAKETERRRTTAGRSTIAWRHKQKGQEDPPAESKPPRRKCQRCGKWTLNRFNCPRCRSILSQYYDLEMAEGAP